MKKNRASTRGEKKGQLKEPNGSAPVPEAPAALSGLDREPEKTSRLDFLLLALFTLLGFTMRLYNIDICQANCDESLNMRVVRAPLIKEFFSALLTVDCHPPLAYLIQKLFYWINPTLVSVRISSAVIGTLAIPAVFWAFRPFLGRRIALATAFLTATSFILVWYSRVARNYALYFTVAVFVFGFFIRLMSATKERNHRRNLWGFALSMLVCIYVHHNALLMLPILGFIYLVWEGLHRQFRVRLMKHLILVGVVLSLLSIPILYQLRTWSFDHFATERTRPSLTQLMNIVASVGWGNGWRLLLWPIFLLGGYFAIRRHSMPVAAAIAAWVIAPFAGYLLLTGMVMKFMWYFYRYVIFIQIAPLALVAACGIRSAELLDRIRVGGRRLFPYALVLLLLIAGRAAILWTPYSTFYRMKAKQHNREQIVRALRTVPYRRILGDNFYFVTGSLREFKPDDINIAYPPVFNNPEEYTRFKVAQFIRESCENDPLLGFLGSGARRAYASADDSWDWMNRHYLQRKQLFNKEGYELARLKLNYFTFLDIDNYFRIRLLFNTLADLPEWYERKGETLGAGFAEGWNPISLYNIPAWKMWYCMEQDARLFLYNAGSNETVTLSFEAQSCAPAQHLTIDQGRKRLFDMDMKMPPVVLYPISGEPPVQAYVSFPKLIEDNEGLMPHFAGFQFSSAQATTLPFTIPHGLSFLRLHSSDQTGVMITELKLKKESTTTP